MKTTSILFFSLLIAIVFGACSKNETAAYNFKFVHIMDNDAATTTVSEKANAIGTYNIYLSTPQSFDTVTVTYKITVGDGLATGVDYEVINETNQVTFLPGIYDMPVRIKWMAHPIDPAKNNTLTIELISVNNAAYNIGLPGKVAKQNLFTIIKVQ
jgi:hypothetical protein